MLKAPKRSKKEKKQGGTKFILKPNSYAGRIKICEGPDLARKPWAWHMQNVAFSFFFFFIVKDSVDIAIFNVLPLNNRGAYSWDYFVDFTAFL